jgi:hypothetical protein
MNAAELRAIVKGIGNLEPYSASEATNDLAAVEKDYECIAQAAEILELLAWAEESGFKVERGERYWWTRGKDSKPMAERTLIKLLRRAREASKS